MDISPACNEKYTLRLNKVMLYGKYMEKGNYIQL